MAWIFSLSIECGEDQSNAEAVRSTFCNLGLNFEYGSRLSQDNENNWWCIVTPTYQSSTKENKNAADLEKGLELLANYFSNLNSQSIYFRYGLVGLEVDLFREYSELKTDKDFYRFPGLVICKNAFAELEEVVDQYPKKFEEINQNYWRVKR